MGNKTLKNGQWKPLKINIYYIYIYYNYGQWKPLKNVL